MKTYELKATPRVDLGKKAAAALRAEGLIPAVINGGEIVELPYKGTLKDGQKLIEIENGRGIITTDITVSNDAVRNQNQLRIAASDGSAEFLIPFIICRAEIFVSN